MSKLWTKDKEREFFYKSLENFANPEKLFYIAEDGNHYSYWPNNYSGKKTTLQSRNALIGDFTEKFCVDLLKDLVNKRGLYAIQGVVCEEIALKNRSPGDVVISQKRGINQEPEDILVIFEVKMSLVWNWGFNEEDEEVEYLGDYKTHSGRPSLLRSDSMLKAIGKAINIRVSSFKASNIPIVILGNTPITQYYYEKVDHLKRCGIIQGFWSLNPKPLDENEENIKQTSGKGFTRIDTYQEIENELETLLEEKREFFSSMKTKEELGKIIEIANREKEYEKKAEKFLALIRR